MSLKSPVPPLTLPVLKRFEQPLTKEEEELAQKVTEAKNGWLEKHMRALAPPHIQRAMDNKWQDKVGKWLTEIDLKLVDDPQANVTYLYRGNEKVGTFQLVYDAGTRKYSILCQ